jgi:putative spermidine/putrescine transport system permease protein
MTAKRLVAWIFLSLVYLFILIPAVIVIVDSLSSATSFPSPFESATLHWYRALLDHEEFLDSIRVSAFVAAIAASASVVLGFLAAYALVRRPVKGRDAVQTLLYGPLFVPQIVIGLAMLQILSLAKLRISLIYLIIVHTVYVMPFTMRLVMTSLSRFDFCLEDAARSLGAGYLRALWHVTLPLVRTGLISGFLFAFILSFVNLPLSLFLTNSRTATLPVVMFAYIESRIDPLVAAAASMIVVAAAAITLVLERIFRLRLLS